MTPKQIYEAERALQDLKKYELALEHFDSYVFGGTVEPVPGSRAAASFPIDNTTLSKTLRDVVRTDLGHVIARLKSFLKSLRVEGFE